MNYRRDYIDSYHAKDLISISMKIDMRSRYTN